MDVVKRWAAFTRQRGSSRSRAMKLRCPAWLRPTKQPAPMPSTRSRGASWPPCWSTRKMPHSDGSPSRRKSRSASRVTSTGKTWTSASCSSSVPIAVQPITQARCWPAARRGAPSGSAGDCTVERPEAVVADQAPTISGHPPAAMRSSSLESSKVSHRRGTSRPCSNMPST